jgi:ketosteroid isomerase-like protein
MSGTETESTRSECAATVAAFLGCVADRDIKGALALLHEDVEIDEPASLAYGGLHKGPGGFVTGVLKVMGGIAEFATDEVTLHDAGDTTVVRMDVTVTARSTRCAIRTSVTEIYEVRDGLIVRIDVFYKDTAALLRIFDGHDVA